MNPESTLNELSGPSCTKEPSDIKTTVDFSTIEHNQPSEVEEESESVLEELSDQSCTTQLLREVTSAVQPDFNHEECYLAFSGYPNDDTVVNTNQMELISAAHFKLSYVKPRCVN